MLDDNKTELLDMKRYSYSELALKVIVVKNKIVNFVIR